MEWVFQILYERRYIKLKGKVISNDGKYEVVKVIARNRTITFKSNRPFLLSKGLRHRRIDWEIIEGVVNNTYLQKEITKQLEDYLKVYS